MSVLVAVATIIVLASCGASPVPEQPASSTPRIEALNSKDIDEEITGKPENIGDGFRKPQQPSLKSASPSVVHSGTTASHTTAQFKNSAVLEHTTNKNVAVPEHTTQKNSPSLEHNTNKISAFQEHSTNKNSAIREQTTHKNMPVLEHTTNKNSAIQEHTSNKNPSVSEHTTHKNSPAPEQPTQNYHVKPHKRCSRKMGDHVFKIHVGTGQVVFFSGVCGPKSCIIKKELINDEL